MPKYLIYNQSTRKITKQYSGRHPDVQTGPGEAFLYCEEDVNDKDFYVGTNSNGRPIPVAKLPAPCLIDKDQVKGNGNDKVILSGLPNGAMVVVKGSGKFIKETADQDDDVIEISFDLAGEYEIIVNHARCKEKIFKVTVNG